MTFIFISDRISFQWGGCEYFPGYSKEEVNKGISLLPDDLYFLLRKSYGLHFDDVSGYYNLSSLDKKKVTSIICNDLKRRVGNPNKYSKSLFDLFGEYSFSEIWSAFERLSSDDQRLLIIAFGENLADNSKREYMSSEDKKRLNLVLHNTFPSRLNNTNLMPDFKRDKLSIVECFSSYSLEELKDALFRLDVLQRSLILKAYGNDLNEVFLIS